MRIFARLAAAWAALTGANREAEKLDAIYALTLQVIARRNDTGRLPRVEKLIAQIHALASEGCGLAPLAMIDKTKGGGVVL